MTASAAEGKHTPAPWHIDGEEDRIVIWAAAPVGRFHIADTVGGRVYPVPAVDAEDEPCEDYSDYREVEANARLIAAAPELLAFAERVEEYLQRVVATWPKSAEPQELREQARDAITKATGAA